MSDETRSGRPERPGGEPADRSGAERPLEGLDRLRVPPPSDLEDAVVDALSARGWIDLPRSGAGRDGAPGPAPAYGSPRGRWATWRPWAMAAIAAGIFLLGAMLGRARDGEAPGAGHEATEGPRFIVLLYEGPGVVRPATDAENAAIVEEYVDWSVAVREAGYDVTGEELADREVALPSPPAEDPDVLAGFHVLSAPSLDAALEVVRTHPHLARGGRIVVRPIVEP